MARPTDPTTVEAVKELALAWMYANGGTVIPATREPGHMLHVPFALLPRPMPRALYAQAVDLAAPFNALVDAVARDTAWLLATLRRTASSDAFTGKLLDLLELVEADATPGRRRQAWMLGVHRSDYMLDEGKDGRGAPTLRQIELNTISSSFGSLSCTVGRLHSFLVGAGGALAADPTTSTFLHEQGYGEGRGSVPPVHTGMDADLLASVLAEGVRAYASTREGVRAAPTLALLFVVQPGERNVMDQRKLEFAFRAATGNAVPVRRVTLAEVHARCTIAGGGGEGALLYSPPPPLDGRAWGVEEVAVVYFRAGYTPEDHPSEVEWSARAVLEVSASIKCPPIAYHLAGTKKVQQALAQPGGVERFVPLPGVAAQLRACFAGLWSLDPAEADEESTRAVAAARAHPSSFVLKPQREGGGNNIYGQDVARALAGAAEGGLAEEDLAGYILMERVWPKEAPSVFVRAGAHATAPALSELGVFGVYLGDGREVRVNRAAGHLLRTKTANSDEGGVAAGFAVLDTPFLLD